MDLPADFTDRLRSIAKTLDGNSPEGIAALNIRAAAAEIDRLRTSTAAGGYETGWVIERSTSEVSRPEYYTGHEYPLQYWSFDNLKALRFARKEDAETIRASGLIFEIPNAHRVADHGWG